MQPRSLRTPTSADEDHDGNDRSRRQNREPHAGKELTHQRIVKGNREPAQRDRLGRGTGTVAGTPGRSGRHRDCVVRRGPIRSCGIAELCAPRRFGVCFANIRGRFRGRGSRRRTVCDYGRDSVGRIARIRTSARLRRCCSVIGNLIATVIPSVGRRRCGCRRRRRAGRCRRRAVAGCRRWRRRRRSA